MTGTHGNFLAITPLSETTWFNGLSGRCSTASPSNCPDIFSGGYLAPMTHPFYRNTDDSDSTVMVMELAQTLRTEDEAEESKFVARDHAKVVRGWPLCYCRMVWLLVRI